LLPRAHKCCSPAVTSYLCVVRTPEAALLPASQVSRAAGCHQGSGCVQAGPPAANDAGGGGDLRWDPIAVLFGSRYRAPAAAWMMGLRMATNERNPSSELPCAGAAVVRHVLRAASAGMTLVGGPIGSFLRLARPHRADRLRPLQGVCIPVLYGCGFWDEGRTYFVATSIVASQHPDRSTCGAGQAAEQVGMLREPQSFSTTQASWACAAVSHHMLSRASEALCAACALATGRRPCPAHPPPTGAAGDPRPGRPPRRHQGRQRARGRGGRELAGDASRSRVPEWGPRFLGSTLPGTLRPD
jgi:hypothetical protein